MKSKPNIKHFFPLLPNENKKTTANISLDVNESEEIALVVAIWSEDKK